MFNIGDKVCKTPVNKSDMLIGEIILLHPDTAVVEWLNGSITKMDLSQLIHLSEWSDAISKIDNELEQAWEQFSSTLQKAQLKLKQAADLVVDANEIMKKELGFSLGDLAYHDYELPKSISNSDKYYDIARDSLYEIKRTLLDAMDESGWNTSSLSC